ncbi:MAG: type II toxin-antitoxin system VapC family toxin [Pyrinomonadaceae bacterium]
MAPPNVKIEPRSVVFVDTSALVALVDNTDFFHTAAREIMYELRRNHVRFCFTKLIIVEFLNSLCSVKFRKRAIDLADSMDSLESVSTISLDDSLYERAYELYRNRPDKNWSLTDCASFVVMKDRGVDLAFTSDKHFEQAGFVGLLEN